MTTKPKARKFRIRRNTSLRTGLDPVGTVGANGAATAPAADQRPPEPEDGFGSAPFPTARAANPEPRTAEGTVTAPMPTGVQSQPGPDTPRSADQDIDAIRREGLTGRQLRMARRIAQKHGLAPTSDYDAVRLLRAKGIDPFQRANMLELVQSEAPGRASEIGSLPALPRTEKQDLAVPALAAPAESRLREVRDIQRDIARRRRRGLALLFARLSVFVLLPTLLAGYYYYTIATPMYATKSEFVIQQAEATGGGGLGSLFQGTGLAMQQDSIAVQSYLQSRDAMLRLDQDRGFRAHFSQDWIDPLRQLQPDSTSEAAYKLYKKAVKIGYDPTEGILKMEVIAADPETSAAFSNALISYAEERVDGLTQRLREDQMAGARASYQEAEEKVAAAQQRVLELQEKLGVLDPASETGALMGQITTFETQLREKRLQLQQLLDNPRPNSARVDGVKGDIRRLEQLVAELRASMTEGGGGADSLARISAELRIAEADLTNRQLLLQQALQQMETARIEANRQVRYLSLGVSPVAPDEPTYPRAFENTVLAFLIFAGIYLMISLTVSVLREQVSA
ncbi:capsule biosynthesis protein [Rhodovulum adriaticum]|uniref:Capsular polysaccharide transport system permease protein n=1 Tax=Rhodovulum adriaticum TaxID=35804 RepID=A0A4R2NJN2_RHOAD|nr:capsule biosynthesis protein [Rhodovulum adriaticum]MBK1634739.1 capsule biosynthesis protein [Rhodovulum adriaticum]TCP21552.1 capsular polysaccharide transport system permease protein [Rhodovulum adriaticum]